MRRNDFVRRDRSESRKAQFEGEPLSFTARRNLTAQEQRLKIMGVMLYWAEGFKRESAAGIDFANSDPAMVKIFVRFLREICGVDERRLRCSVYCYSNHDSSKLIAFWSHLVRIPRSQFIKTYVRSDFKLEKVNRMPNGLIHVRYSDKKLLRIVLGWIEDYKIA